jgi:pyrroloquinoline quinone biosynthesis protein E
VTAVVQPRPYGLLAEFTHACPLHCPYCSNPLELARRSEELPGEVWERVMAEAAALGVLQVGCSGGEPLLYQDLNRVIESIRREGMYSNLITSGVGLDAARAGRLRESGLDAVQISFQSDEAGLSDALAGTRAHELKIQACIAVRDADLPLGLNVVLHRGNIDRLPDILEMAAELGAMRIELAHVQFAGWAWKNRTALLPSRAQVARAAEVADQAVANYAERFQVIYVMPDWYGNRPKPCLHGWGQRGITINPRGDVLPCQAAEAIPGMTFENIRDRSLASIWHQSDAFNRFRGTDWMPEPCRSCPEKLQDFGGCRCQAALWTGDPTQTDPVCEFSPHRTRVDALLDAADSEAGREWTYRSFATSSGVTGAAPSPNRLRM